MLASSVSAEDVVKNGLLIGSIKGRKEVFKLNGKHYLIEYTGDCWRPKASCRILMVADNLSEIKGQINPEILSLKVAV